MPRIVRDHDLDQDPDAFVDDVLQALEAGALIPIAGEVPDLFELRSPRGERPMVRLEEARVAGDQ